MEFRQARLPYVRNNSKLFSTFWYYTSSLTLLSVFVSVVLVFIWMFGELRSDDGRLTYIVNSYFSSESPMHVDPTWQVASKHWGLPGGASTTPASATVYTPYYSNEGLTPMTECMYTAQIALPTCRNETLEAYFKCIKANFNTQLTACEALPSNKAYLFPIRTDYAECVWKTVGVNPRYNHTVLQRCMDITFWPIYEVIQDVDSEYFLGSYNWALFLVVGFSFFISIIGYSSWPFKLHEDADNIVVKHGKPETSQFMPRGSLAQVAAFFVFVLTVVIMVSVMCWDYSQSWNTGNGVPSTVSTQVVVFTCSMAGLVYFLCELAEFWDAKENSNVPSEIASKIESANLLSNKSIPVAFQMQVPNVNYYLNPNTEDGTISNYDSVLKRYGLYLMKTWADAYFFDVLIFVGIMGCTQHVVLAEVYNLFWLTVTLRLTQMVVNRQLYAGYIRSEDLAGTFKNRAFVLAAELACIFNIINILFIVFNSNRLSIESGVFVAFFVLALVIPESLKLLLHIYLLMDTHEKIGPKQNVVYIPRKAAFTIVLYQFIVMWDVVVRLIIIGSIFSSNFVGSKPFWVDRHKGLMAWMA